MEPRIISHPCPVSDCGGTVKHHAGLAPGDYPCPCKAAILRLYLAGVAFGGKEPRLVLVARNEGED